MKCPWQTTLSWLVSLVKSQLHLSGQKETIEGDSPGLRPDTGDLEKGVIQFRRSAEVTGMHCGHLIKDNCVLLLLTRLCSQLAWQQWRQMELGLAQI